MAAFLMSKAIPIQAVSAETKPIHEWTYRDILKLPAAAQEDGKPHVDVSLIYSASAKSMNW